MSYDLYYWKSADVEPARVCRRLARRDVTGLQPSPDVRAFRTAILTRWPDLADRISPWAEDLGWRLPLGKVGLDSHFVSLSLSLSTPDAVHQELQREADRWGLICFDPQREVDDEDADDDEDDLADDSDTEASPAGAVDLFAPTEREARMDRASFAALLRTMGLDGRGGA